MRSKWVVILAHPFEATLSLAMVASGVITLFVEPTTSLIHRDLSGPLAIIWTISIILGGAFTFAGVMSERGDAIQYALERGGLYLTASATAVYAIVLVYSGRVVSSLLLVSLFTALTIACLLRAHAIGRANKKILEALVEATRGGTGNG